MILDQHKSQFPQSNNATAAIIALSIIANSNSKIIINNSIIRNSHKSNLHFAHMMDEQKRCLLQHPIALFKRNKKYGKQKIREQKLKAQFCILRYSLISNLCPMVMYNQTS